jgi:CubicO group peptidase (beta-lactamase class C family)
MHVSTQTTTAEPAPPVKKGGAWRWIKRILLALLILIVLLVAFVIGALLYFHVPSNSAGLAAQSVCSGTFVAGRDPQAVFTDDVLPQSPALAVISTDVDQAGRTVTAKFLGLFSRQASLLPNRGCVLDVPPDPAAVPYTPVPQSPKLWPQGDAAVPLADWDPDVDKAGLAKVMDQAFVGAGDPNAANARSMAVVYKGRLLAQKQGKGFTPTTPLLGWSMTKTVNAMLFYKKATEAGLDLETPVVDAFAADREPPWVAQWRQDDRKSITINDLLFMRAGLDNGDDYGPLAKVVQMLYGEPSMADFAAEQPLIHPPGTFWEYSTGIADMISQVAQGMFPSDDVYWKYPRAALFAPTGVTSATLATDTSGTWVGGSYLWADTGDWARLGQMMLDDGEAEGKAVLPAGWWKLAGTPAMPDGDGHGYGAQTWIPGDKVGGECKAYPGVPADTLSMEGHYGQLVALVPSHDAVIVRLGWTITSSNFDGCQLISDVLKTLPKTS